MFNDLSSVKRLLETRRSARPRDLVEPGPNAEQLDWILRTASRTPDHGKLHPWRFVHIPATRRDAFAALLDQSYRLNSPDPGRLEREANERFARQAPELIVLLSSPVIGHKIPVWEQELSCGAVGMNLLLAASSIGFGAGWVTGWAAYSETVRDAFGSAPERIAGFFFLGTSATPLEERPRPEPETVIGRWDGSFSQDRTNFT